MSVQGAPNTAITITVAGANLFQLAVQYLGDVTQWYRICRLNNIIPPDHIVTGLVTLRIPPNNVPSNGGILTYQ